MAHSASPSDRSHPAPGETPSPNGVSFVVPVHNGARWLDETLSAIFVQADGRPFEVLAVDDGSTDASPAILEAHAARGNVRVMPGPGRGAAAAINVGVRAAVHPIICQVDQDVILRPGWMRCLTAALSDASVGAAQGYYLTAQDAGIWARGMGLDLEQRYGRIRGTNVDHVCTGNSAYRAAALRQVSFFDETLGYGYDNDMSYRLAAAGYRLMFCREARSVHRWRETMWGYLGQQYGVGYGRLDLIAKHRGRAGGDDVSGLRMILHAPAMLCALAALTIAMLLAAIGAPWRLPAVVGGGVLVILALDRLVAGLEVLIRRGDLAGLTFVPIHLLRDAAWALALIVWTARRLGRQARRPSHSMR